MLIVFSCACWPSICHLQKNVYSSLCPFFNWVVFSFDIELYELFIYFGYQPFISHIISKYFLPFSRLSFHLVTVFFAMQKLLRLIRSHLFIFVFVSFALGDSSKKYCYDLSQRVFCLFFSRSFMVSGLIFRSLTHFEFILYMVWENVLISFFYMELSSFPSTTYWTECVFSIIYSCLFCHWFIGRKCMDLFLGSLSSHFIPGYISKEKGKTLIWKGTCTPMFIAALFIITKKPKCPSIMYG